MTTVAVDTDLVARIRAGVIGEGELLPGPYGPSRLTYADYTASGRALDFVEDYIRDRVLPSYANTHSESAATGRRTTQLREHARSVIHRAVGGTGDDLVLFCGSGSTAAVDKLTRLLGVPGRRDRTVAPPPERDRPVVFVGPYEHHSNELPWRESAADVVAIGEDRGGGIDAEDLRARLVRFRDRPLRIGSFSAASNVTGILSDTGGITSLLHRYGALAVWDYTAAAPYLPVRMREGAHAKDAVVFSPHKFIGGPQTPGVLVVRRELVGDGVPSTPGGGTIAFVDPVGALYLDDPVAREEGGTPAIVESIRAGLVLALKEAVGTDRILALERRWWRRALDTWGRNPRLEILGNLTAPRLPIVSVRIHHRGRVLHHEFVVAVLNDLFGIQARGGCSCAGPYGHRLLCITPQRSAALRAQAARGYLGIKPGWVRITFTHFMSEALVDFLVEAVDLVATFGHRLLGDYLFDPRSGHWQHRDAPPPAAVSFDDVLREAGPRTHLGEDVFAAHLDRARSMLAARPDFLDDRPSGLPPELEELREFHLPAGGLR